MKTLKVLAALLTYPEPEILEAAGAFTAVLKAENWLSASGRKDVEGFLSRVAGMDIDDLREAYVALFDRTPSLSLYLFEHVHGDSRDRGQALVELDSLYRERGLENASEHTPDYLPLFLEYLSLLPPREARENLQGAIDVIAAVGARLKKRESFYAVLFDALEDMAARKPDPRKLSLALKASDGRALAPEDMDAAWEQQFALAPLTEGTPGGCPRAEDMLKRMETGS